MPFGVVSGVGRGMGVLDGVVIVERNGQFRGEFGASHCNQWEWRRALPKLLWGGLVSFFFGIYCRLQVGIG